MATNLKVGKTNKALANLTTTIAPQNPLTPWGDSPQAKRLLSALPAGETPAPSPPLTPSWPCVSG